MMAFQPIDAALLLVSIAACLYCMVLSRRLASLQNTKDGLGSTITACTDSISAMSAATRGTTAQAKELATTLAALLERAEDICQKVESQTNKMEAKHRQAGQKIQHAQSELDLIMRGVLEQHKKQIADIVELTKQARPLTSHTQEAIKGPHQTQFKNLVETNNKQRHAQS